ncbi:kinase-like protein [Trametes cingulata]|nr:kinase-like protein [Trametes cingulata]
MCLVAAVPGDAQGDAMQATDGQLPPRILVPATPDGPGATVAVRSQRYSPKNTDVILNRYRVRSRIGQGTFGTVVRAQDTVTGTTVAIKLLHKEDLLHGDMRVEEKVYALILSGCQPHVGLFAAVIDSGSYRGFHCVVFDLCDCTLDDVVKAHLGIVPLPSRHLMEIAYQLVKGVEYLHSLGIIHTDIKPDNVALRSSGTTTMKWLDINARLHEKKILISTHICIIDLGNAVDVQTFHVQQGRVGARSYQAPEVTLGLSWSFGVDVFAIGCVVAELYLMRRLLLGIVLDDREHLAHVNRIIGPFPEAYARAIEAKYSGTFAFSDGRVVVVYPPGGSTVSAADFVGVMRWLEQSKPLSTCVHDVRLHGFLRKLMAPNPADRAPLSVACKHEYFDPLYRAQLL